jgi:GT2 family glycosyltransferase
VITIAIPTYNRGAILVETVSRLLPLEPRPYDFIIVDQTRAHPPEVENALQRWSDETEITWLVLPEPSIPGAMNSALLNASSPLVLFLDDDIIPDTNLIRAHIDAHRDENIWAVAGQVLQPGEQPEEPRNRGTEDLEFPFNSTQGRFITNVMAGNLSVKRERALQIGGFDRNFVGAAYRFETDFAMRIAAAGGKIWFEPAAVIRHLQLSTGGLRSYGDHRTSASPLHSCGDYYFALHHVPRFWSYAARRIVKNVVTRYHASHPWTIPFKITGELRGLMLARKLYRKGRRLLTVPRAGSKP